MLSYEKQHLVGTLAIDFCQTGKRDPPDGTCEIILEAGFMSLEIERKFLVADDRWKNAVIGSVKIRDGLIASTDGQKVRVRIS